MLIVIIVKCNKAKELSITINIVEGGLFLGFHK